MPGGGWGGYSEPLLKLLATPMPGSRVRRQSCTLASQKDSALRQSRKKLVGAALAWAALAWGQTALARPFDPAGTDWEGCADFVRLATDELGPRAVVASKIAFDELTPADSLVLIEPDTGLDMASFDAFLKAGGRVALFDDFGKGEGLLHRYGIERVPPPSQPAAELRHNPQ